MRILLKPGETLEVGFYEEDPFEGWNTLDGNFKFEFVAEQAIRITADMPDSTGRDGVIYEEIFGQPSPQEKAFVAALDGQSDGAIYAKASEKNFPDWQPPEIGEHQVVQDAIDGCNSGEEN